MSELKIQNHQKNFYANNDIAERIRQFEIAAALEEQNQSEDDQ